MKNALAYFDVLPKSQPSRIELCFRALFVVASCWNLLGVGCMTFALNAGHAPRLRALALGCFLVSAAIYSVSLPLWYILRPSKPNP